MGTDVRDGGRHCPPFLFMSDDFREMETGLALELDLESEMELELKSE